jgi:GAF domain-containing protein
MLQSVGVSSDRVDAEIGKALRELLEFFDLDRCIFLRGSQEGGARLMHPDHLVCAPGVGPVPREIDQQTLHPWLAKQLRAHGLVNLTFGDVPAEAATDLQTMERFAFKSLVVVRFVVGESEEYFADEFVRAENRLCRTDDKGRPVHDGSGNPVLECMCGNVLASRCDPRQPFFTENGSFWTNSTSDLLASATEVERQAPTRNRCHAEGYESVALIPLHAAGETFGLLQFNDRRRGVFSSAFIGLAERLALNIASAIAQLQAAEALRSSQRELCRERQSLAEAQRIGKVGSWEFDYLPGCRAFTPAYRRFPSTSRLNAT